MTERSQRRGAATHATVDRRVRADDGHGAERRRIEREHGPPVIGRAGLVAQEHGAGDGGAPRQRSFGRVVDGGLGDVGGPFVGVGAVGEEQQVAHEAVDLCLLDVAALHRGDELVAVHAHRSGHLEAEAGVGGRGGVVDAVPVGDDEPVETPLVAQDVGQQSAVLGAVLAVELVVGAHDAPGVRLLDGPLEGPQVQLAQGAFVDPGVDGHALDLGVVGDEVLHRDGDVVRLHARDVGDGQRCR